MTNPLKQLFRRRPKNSWLGLGEFTIRRRQEVATEAKESPEASAEPKELAAPANPQESQSAPIPTRPPTIEDPHPREDLRRFTRELHAHTCRMGELERAVCKVADAAKTLGSPVPVVADPDLTETLKRIPELVDVAYKIPERSLAALERLERFATAIQAQHHYARQNAETLAGLRNDLRRTLKTMRGSLGEMSELHRLWSHESITSATQYNDSLIRHQETLEHMEHARRQDLACLSGLLDSGHRRQEKFAQRVMVAALGIVLVVLIGAGAVVDASWDQREASPHPSPMIEDDTVSIDPDRYPPGSAEDYPPPYRWSAKDGGRPSNAGPIG